MIDLQFTASIGIFFQSLRDNIIMTSTWDILVLHEIWKNKEHGHMNLFCVQSYDCFDAYKHTLIRSLLTLTVVNMLTASIHEYRSVCKCLAVIQESITSTYSLIFHREIRGFEQKKI